MKTANIYLIKLNAYYAQDIDYIVDVGHMVMNKLMFFIVLFFENHLFKDGN